jgi:hypothetical protein
MWVYERNRTKPYSQNADTAARKANFYSVQREGGRWDDSIEAFLGIVESEAVLLIQQIATCDVKLSWEDRERVVLYIALQEFRVPHMREQIEDSEETSCAGLVLGCYGRLVGQSNLSTNK